MSRLTDAILDQKAFGRGQTQPMLDLRHGGQFGWAPNLTEWNSNQAYVRRDLVCILLEAPRFFSLMPEPEILTASLKALLELHPRTIEGMNAGLTVETDSHPVGGAGEIQEEFIDVKRAPSLPVFGYTEKYGMVIQNFLEFWIQYGMMSPESKYALTTTLSGNKPDDALADWYTASCLFFEPDPNHRKVVKAWVSTNMFPKGTGDISGKRDLTSAKELNTLSIEFTALSQYGIGTKVFAQKILDSINMTNANPNLRESFIADIAGDVKAANNGYIAGVTDLANKTIK
jgi:hypothetical protein